jgi:DNA polymerase type B, organellar and viral
MFINKKWNLKEESIFYCENDVIILYKVLIKFNEIIFNTFNIDALKYPTLSSLSFAIYRTNYLKFYKIPLITGNLYKALKLSYTGGSVDVYKPFGTNINGYDVNSLYPTVMLKNDMPVGNPIYFEGDVYKYETEPFGFFEVEVNAPLDLNVPILQKRILTKNGYRTIAPVGKWTGTYFSEEIKAAKKLGYTFKVINGFIFNKLNIFKDFINDLYKFKENSNKNSADYIIYKLLMNSLYGRFGMKPDFEKSLIISEKDLDKLLSGDFIIPKKIIELKNKKILINFYDLNDDLDLSNNNRKISVSIASAITAYARIYMSFFKNLDNIELYYSDTDSLYIKGELDSKYISDKELGKFKLEKTFLKALFLSAKMYAGKYLNKNKEIKTYCKIKGLKHKVDFNKLLPLLFKNRHIDFEQEKWHKDLFDSSIEIKNTTHKLEISSVKRRIIYNNQNKFIDTKPIILKNSKIETLDEI